MKSQPPRSKALRSRRRADPMVKALSVFGWSTAGALFIAVVDTDATWWWAIAVLSAICTLFAWMFTHGVVSSR